MDGAAFPQFVRNQPACQLNLSSCEQRIKEGQRGRERCSAHKSCSSQAANTSGPGHCKHYEGCRGKCRGNNREKKNLPCSGPEPHRKARRTNDPQVAPSHRGAEGCSGLLLVGVKLMGPCESYLLRIQSSLHHLRMVICTNHPRQASLSSPKVPVFSFSWGTCRNNKRTFLLET